MYPSHADGSTFRLSAVDILYFYDGDTFFIRCDGCPDKKLGVRPLGYDSPERKGKCEKEKRLARQAKQYLVQIVRNAGNIELVPNQRRPYDRWGRLLTAVYLDGQNLSEIMINAGMARDYVPGKPYSWC